MATRKLAILPRRLKSKNRDSSFAALQQKARITIASEAVFANMLRLERHRTERSGRPVMLVIISGNDLKGRTGGAHASSAAAEISSTIRETDFLGWYEQDKTLGVLITEISQADEATVETIVQKISAALQKSVAPEVFCRLALVVRLFPDHGGDAVFYPDVCSRPKPEKIDHGIKRGIDLCSSLAALMVLLPVLLAIAALVKTTSAGPVLFCQKRLGKRGKEFQFFKFRTMYTNNDPSIHREYTAKLIAGGVSSREANGGFKMANDPRITPLGRFLRRSSLDELPQFFNVLLNDMSLVGPRPPLPYEYENYKGWHRRRVLESKPGITGLWQVKGRSRTSFDEMVRLDIEYLKRRNLWLDLKIILQTPAAMFFGRGAC